MDTFSPSDYSDPTILKLLLGDSRTFSLERRILNASLFASIIISTVIMLKRIIFHVSQTATILSITAVFCFVLCYGLGRRVKESNWLIWGFLCINITCILLDWLFIGGFSGIGITILVILSGVLPIIASRKQYLVCFTLIVVVFIVLTGTSVFLYTVIPQYPFTLERVFDLLFVNAILSIGVGTLSYLVMKSYRHQSRNIEAAKLELIDLNNEVNFINKKLAEQNKILKIQATKDPLTGTHNRRSFYELTEEHWSMAVRKKEDCSVILFDIDHFKQVNDTFGHYTGDLVLKELATLTQQAIRTYDRLGRWGGEEFILYLPDTNIEQAEIIAERLRESIEKKAFKTAEGSDIDITISIGISSKTVSNTLEMALMFEHADKALYSAKKSGRNKVCTYKHKL